MGASRPGFLTITLLTFRAGPFLVVVVGGGCCRQFSSIPDLDPQHCPRSWPCSCDIQKCLWPSPNWPWGQSHPQSWSTYTGRVSGFALCRVHTQFIVAINITDTLSRLAYFCYCRNNLLTVASSLILLLNIPNAWWLRNYPQISFLFIFCQIKVFNF